MSELSQAKGSRMTRQLLLLIELAAMWGAGCIALWATGRILAGWLLWGGVALGVILERLILASKLPRPKDAN